MDLYTGHAGHLAYGDVWEAMMCRVLRRAKARGIDTQACYEQLMAVATRLCERQK